jgi:2-oxoglutarate ferredoxin oxidoreductase subunit beta
LARAIDTHKNLPNVLKAAHAHQGAAFVEIFQNCIVYNADVFADFTDKANAAPNQLWLEDGKPVLFDGGNKGIALDRDKLQLKVVEVVDGDWQAAGVIVHDVTNRSVAHMLIELRLQDGFPVALGVIFDDPRPTFDSAVIAQNVAVSKGKTPDLQGLLAKGQTWTVEKENTVFG